jgi:tRNA U34 5-methylaminomethyl-2-thiouridine-forming methyltransferase MnmC
MSLFLTEDGSHSIYSEQFGVAYHSTHGAIQETQHIFIEAALCHFIQLNQDKNIDEIKILDIGFGTGLNVFMTFLESQNRQYNIDLTTIEAYPLSISTAETLNYAQLLNVPQYEHIFKQLHSLSWEEKHAIMEKFTYQKHLLDFKEIAYTNTFDIVFYDAFSPETQPDLWDEMMMGRIFNALKSGGIMTTYCAKGSFKRALKSVGFQVEGIPGPRGKREITRATKKIT